MSMLSAQCDRLRETAELVEDHGRFVGFGGSISTDPLMVDAAKEMRDAADTIWQLRNDCVELRDENEKLREYVHTLELETIRLDSDNCDLRGEMEPVWAENAKLRELVAEMLDNLMPEICAKAFWCRDKDWRKCKDDACGNYTFVILARELGVTT